MKAMIGKPEKVRIKATSISLAQKIAFVTPTAQVERFYQQLTDFLGKPARERASNMNAQFVDARIAPFMQCRCGALLDFTTMDSCELVM